MINTRRSIFKTLKWKIRELTKHADYAPKDFKKIMIAVILNDLKEWSEYIPKDDPNAIVKMLNNFLLCNGFIIDRMPSEKVEPYVNVNTPQTNTTWHRVWDKKTSDIWNVDKLDPMCTPWEVDDTCEIQIVYFYTSVGETPLMHLKSIYGEYGEKLKTVCDKMNIFVDRQTGVAYYLTTDCQWKEVGGENSGITEDTVKTLIANSHINHQWSDTDANITTTIVNPDVDEYDNTLNITTADNDLNSVIYGNQ